MKKKMKNMGRSRRKKRAAENKWMLPAFDCGDWSYPATCTHLLIDRRKSENLACRSRRISRGNYPFLVWCAKFGKDPYPMHVSGSPAVVKYEVKACHHF